jgi:tetratricopeptide (TPR) repeat protein
MTARTWRIMGLLFISVAVFFASLTQLSEWDTFHHLAYGRDILRRGGFAAEDPFLYPLADRPSGGQPSWLGSVLIYLSWLVAGNPGPVYLTGLLGAALFAVLLLDALDGDKTPEGVAIALLSAAFALAVFRERAVARPELFANVLLAWTILVVRRHAAGKGRLLLVFPAVAVLWANLHPSVLLGVTILVVFVVVNGAPLLLRRLGARLQHEVSGSRALVAPMAVALAALVAVVALSPGGTSLLLSPVDFVLSVIRRPAGSTGAVGAEPWSLLVRAVDELRPPTQRQWLGPFGWGIGLCALSFLLRWKRVNLREAAMCAAFVYLASTAQRFMVLAAIVIAPVGARNLRAVLAEAPAASRRLGRYAVVALSVAGIGAAAWNMFHLPGIRFGTGVAREMPVRSAEYLRSIGFRGRLFNTFHLGGYLEWALDQKVFQDGRGHLLPGDAAAAVAGPSAYVEFESLDSRYRFDALVTHYPQFADSASRARLASARGGDWGADRATWALVAFDDGGQVYLRRDGAYAAFAARDEYRSAMPANPLALPQPSDPGRLMLDLERSLREAPGCLRCRTMLGLLLNETGHSREAEAILLPATEGPLETQLFALMGLARAAEARGDRATAASRWRSIIALAPDPAWSRRQLAGVLLEDGRLDEAWSAIRKNLGHAGETFEDLDLGIRIARAKRDQPTVEELWSRLMGVRVAEQAQTLYSAGVAFMRSGRMQEAISALRRSIELNERVPVPHFALAQVYEIEGDRPGAAAEYRRYLDLDPGGPWSQQARARVEALQGGLR